MTVFKAIVAIAVAGLTYAGVHVYAGVQEWQCTSHGNVWSAYDPNERNVLEYQCYTFESIKAKHPVLVK